MIKIYKKSIIYIACPPAVATGGPLALHQLAVKLKSIGFNVFMYYYRDNVIDPIHQNYKHYNIPFVYKIEDDKKNVLVVAESKSNLLYHYENLRGVIWWLSVDNFYDFPVIYKMFNLLGLSKPKPKFLHFINNLKLPFNKNKNFVFKDIDKFYHLSQSVYAYEYIINKSNKKINISMLTDYLLEGFLENNDGMDEREDIILYNPAKGKNFTQKLIKRDNNLNWIPIQNMTPVEVKKLLSKAKLYVDFGEHPGRDRFPREAVISGCCIVTGIRGSAYYDDDIPIDSEFKFKESISNIPVIIGQLKNIINNYDDEVKKFDQYRDFIRNNEKTFESEVKMSFVKIDNW